MGPRAGLDGRKISSHRDSIPDRPARSSVAIPTELPGPHYNITFDIYRVGKTLRPPYDEELTLPRNVVFRLRSVAVSCRRRTETSAIPLRKPEKGIVIVFGGFSHMLAEALGQNPRSLLPLHKFNLRLQNIKCTTPGWCSVA